MEFDGKNYHKPQDLAEAILFSRGIDTQINQEILGSAPYANQLTPELFNIVVSQLASANVVLPQVKELLTSMIDSIITDSPHISAMEDSILSSENPEINIYKTLQLIDYLLKRPEDSLHDMGFTNKSPFQLALLQEGISLTKKLHRKIEDPDLKKMMLSFTIYYSALQVLNLGMQTNSILLLHDQENFMKSDSDKIGMAVSVISPEGHEKTKMKMLFEGYTILDEKKSNDGANYLVIKTNTPDEDTT